METEALVPATDVQDVTLVALTPAELPAAQHALTDWCAGKIAAHESEIKDLEEHSAIAKANGWKLQAVARQLSLARRRIVYYQKIATAVAEGYLIVPNMPVDVFAVRVNREHPGDQRNEGSWRQPMPVDPMMLPAGEGRYVGDEFAQHRDEYQDHDKDGKLVKKFHWLDDGYAEVDFPVRAVKPIVLEATARALGLKLFDQLGIVRDNGVNQTWRRRGDPIVVGQFIDPRGQGRGVTFFVAWWLDTFDTLTAACVRGRAPHERDDW